MCLNNSEERQCCLTGHCCLAFFKCKSSIPLACAVYRFLECVHNLSAISRAVQRHRQVPHSIFTTALAEPQVAFDVDVVYGSWWTFSITRCHTNGALAYTVLFLYDRFNDQFLAYSFFSFADLATAFIIKLYNAFIQFAFSFIKRRANHAVV